MVATAPEIYKKYVSIKRNGELVLYVEALNALYGIMKAALLFYIKFVKNLKSIGFELNPYDPCMVNKIVDGAQLTVVWHVNYMKVIHMDAGVVTRMSVCLQKTYERLFDDGSGAMKLKQGKIHEYLGMQLDFSVAGQVKITMFDYIQENLEDFHKYDLNKTIYRTPAADHLFKVRDDQPKLDEQKAQTFHTFTAKALFATKLARPDIRRSIAFLTTRVICPDEDDWNKLLCMMRYLRGTK